MNCVISNSITANISFKDAGEIVMEAIASSTPFAYTRFGDGEAALLQTLLGIPPNIVQNPKNTPQDNFNNLSRYYDRVIRVWGANTQNYMLAVYRICGPILEGLINSDLIGLHPKGIPNFYMLTKPNYKGCPPHILTYLTAPDKLGAFFQGKDVRLFSNHGNKLCANIQKQTKSKIALTTIPMNYTINDVQKTLDSISDFPEQLVLWGGGAGAKQLGVHLRDKFGKTCSTSSSFSLR